MWFVTHDLCLILIISKLVVEQACSMLKPNMCVIIRHWKDTIVIKCILDKKMSQQICSVGDALPIPWRIQKWVQVQDIERGKSRGTFL
jgi:hypothetical protein